MWTSFSYSGIPGAANGLTVQTSGASSPGVPWRSDDPSCPKVPDSKTLLSNLLRFPLGEMAADVHAREALHECPPRKRKHPDPSVGKRPRSTASLSRLSNSDRISLLSRCGDSDESKWITRLPRRTRIPVSPAFARPQETRKSRPLRPRVAVNAQIRHPNARQFVGRGCLTVRGLGYRGALTRRARAPAPLCNRSCGLAGCTPRT
jgi:hypothetical protein